MNESEIDQSVARLLESKSVLRRLVEHSTAIRQSDPENITFLRGVMCQLGMPRSRQQSRRFERTSGNASLLMEAGQLFKADQWVEMPLPYGTRPPPGADPHEHTGEHNNAVSLKSFLERNHRGRASRTGRTKWVSGTRRLLDVLTPEPLR